MPAWSTPDALQVSDLMVGGPEHSASELLQPTVGYSVVFGVGARIRRGLRRRRRRA